MLLGLPGLKRNVLTVIVAAFSVVLALLVFGIDTVFSGVISEYFGWIKS